MTSKINWEIKIPSFSDKSPREIVNIINSVFVSDFKELDVWLNKQVENKNLKGFKRTNVKKVNFNQRNRISILDLKFNEKYFKTLNLMEYDERTYNWEEIKFNHQFLLRKFNYTLKIPLKSNFKNINPNDITISIPEPWFVEIKKIIISNSIIC